jgi:hypothetical protein
VTRRYTETEVSQLFDRHHRQRRFNNVLLENITVLVPHFWTTLGGVRKANKNMKRDDGNGEVFDHCLRVAGWKSKG